MNSTKLYRDLLNGLKEIAIDTGASSEIIEGIDSLIEQANENECNEEQSIQDEEVK